MRRVCGAPGVGETGISARGGYRCLRTECPVAGARTAAAWSGKLVSGRRGQPGILSGFPPPSPLAPSPSLINPERPRASSLLPRLPPPTARRHAGEGKGPGAPAPRPIPGPGAPRPPSGLSGPWSDLRFPQAGGALSRPVGPHGRRLSPPARVSPPSLGCSAPPRSCPGTQMSGAAADLSH
uniref:Retinoic acid receptor RXR-beta-like n=1 Tax=Phascolarctos cinereus TaxID=38626 RepID=A0A6P5I9B4_PHACI|nr:retinoic acid receptor RXR-beta-like [Phascolarctos cinereus]